MSYKLTGHLAATLTAAALAATPAVAQDKTPKEVVSKPATKTMDRSEIQSELLVRFAKLKSDVTATDNLMQETCCSLKVVAEFDKMAEELGVKVDKKKVKLADVATIEDAAAYLERLQ